MKLCLLPSVPMCATSVRYQRGIRHAIHWYAKANGKYMNDYDYDCIIIPGQCMPNNGKMMLKTIEDEMVY